MIQTNIARFADAHCHVDLFSDPIRFAAERAAATIPTVAMTNAPSVFFYTKELAAHNPFIIPAAGLHPELAHSHAAELTALICLIDTIPVVGEVGLDYTERDQNIREVQRRIFSAVLEKCAEVGNRILSIHSRRASAEIISMIGPKYPGSVILHWFTGSAGDVQRAISNGYFFSVNCAMSKSENGRRILAELPSSRIITETDGPFMKCCSKGAFGTHVIAELSRIWNQSTYEVSSKLYENFRSLFPTGSNEG